MSDTLIFKGQIVAKPRMTQRDKWTERTATSKYWGFKDHLRLTANTQGFMLSDCIEIKISFPMPKSWTKKKREILHLKPHRQKPDIDNLIKSVQDILLPDDDSGIWSVCAEKYWTKDDQGTLVIRNI
ncbi:MAG: RusA family crossover junction endodeoxyribonuclease [Prolixibacteraceae bacterium]|nr:RusA family crossover junction endodeoxyribonuclease [Prolixibacteraceae bacterium]